MSLVLSRKPRRRGNYQAAQESESVLLLRSELSKAICYVPTWPSSMVSIPSRIATSSASTSIATLHPSSVASRPTPKFRAWVWSSSRLYFAQSCIRSRALLMAVNSDLSSRIFRSASCARQRGCMLLSQDVFLTPNLALRSVRSLRVPTIAAVMAPAEPSKPRREAGSIVGAP